ncbi:lipid asymmetry maintenance ABC transporter permease subunit MlaE [Oceaniserpentilla sp. 4NH20-0058]|uniref:lipid asymmetry maintenance ABC transporter permease subunit MlaE n=1 Tax=Oceaniserpentilla sp. 4NH20-0058 TaxID=3127660 RepID=UPI0031066568
MISYIINLGDKALGLCQALGQWGVFLLNILNWGRGFKGPCGRLITQVFHLGVLSLPIILVAGVFVGMVLALQGYYILSSYGSQEVIGQMVALSLLREFGPVMSALLFVGRAGSALTAEIGLMKTTEQLSAMEIMGVDPYQRVFSPRLWAGVISLPLLTILFSLLGIYGGAFVAVEILGIYEGSYWANMQHSVLFVDDVLKGVFKALVFAFVCTWIALFHGWRAEPTSQGVSLATTATVVQGSLAVLGLDFVLTAVMLGGF